MNTHLFLGAEIEVLLYGCACSTLVPLESSSKIACLARLVQKKAQKKPTKKKKKEKRVTQILVDLFENTKIFVYRYL